MEDGTAGAARIQAAGATKARDAAVAGMPDATAAKTAAAAARIAAL